MSLGTGLAPQTVNKLLTTAAAVFKYAARIELLEKNPAAAVERCKTNSGELGEDTDVHTGAAVNPDEVLSPADAGKMIAAAAPGFYRTYFTMAVLTGMRVGEQTALRCSDVDLEGSKVHIRRVCRGRGSAAKRPTRPGRATTPRRPDPPAGRSTSPLPSSRSSSGWKLACPPSADDLVFPDDLGTPRHRSVLTHKGLRPALRAAKLPQVSLHSLRHSFASALIMQGRPVTQVAALLGHSSPSITLAVYSHWFRAESSCATIAELAGIVLA